MFSQIASKAGRLDYDWVFYMDRHPQPPHWKARTDGLDMVIVFIEQFFAEEIVAFQRGARSGALFTSEVATWAGGQFRSWRGTFDRDP